MIFGCLRLLPLLAAFAAPVICAAETDPEIENAIRLIKASEDKIKCLEWRVRFVHGQMEDPASGDFWAMAGEQATFIESHLRFDTVGKRYIVATEGLFEWYPMDGGLEMIPMGEKRVQTFDGETYRGWSRKQVGATPKDDDESVPTSGRVSATDDQEFGEAGFLGMMGRPTAIFWMRPCFLINEGRQPRRLSEQFTENLKNGRAIRLKKVPGTTDVWRFTTFGSEEEGWVRETVDVDFDMKRGVAVRARWYEDLSEKGQPDFELREMKIVPQEIDGVWIPSRIAMVEWNTNDKLLKHWHIRDVKVNPEIEKEDFRIEFPENTELE